MGYYLNYHREERGRTQEMMHEMTDREARQFNATNKAWEAKRMTATQAHTWVKAGRPHNSSLYVEMVRTTWGRERPMIRRAGKGEEGAC